MRGGSAPLRRGGKCLCPAEKAETAARCGFKVPVLEGARSQSIAQGSFVPRLHERPGAVRIKANSRSAGCGPGALSDPERDQLLAPRAKRPTGPVRAQLGGNAVETSPQ